MRCVFPCSEQQRHRLILCARVRVCNVRIQATLNDAELQQWIVASWRKLLGKQASKPTAASASSKNKKNKKSKKDKKKKRGGDDGSDDASTTPPGGGGGRQMSGMYDDDDDDDNAAVSPGMHGRSSRSVDQLRALNDDDVSAAAWCV